jgi:hypothetical protein
MLEHIASVVTIVGFPLAFIGVWIAYKEGRNSRDLSAALSISDAFLEVFLPVWNEVVTEHRAVRDNTAEPHVQTAWVDNVLKILNWLNAMGFTIDSHLMARPDRVLPPIVPTLRQMLDFTVRETNMLQSFEQRDGLDRWRGVRVLDRTVSELTPAREGAR